MNHESILLIVLPWCAAIPALVGKLLDRRFPFVHLGVFILLSSFWPLWRLHATAGGWTPYFLGGWEPPVGIALGVDRLSLALSLITVVVVLAVLLYSLGQRRYGGLYFAFVLVLTGGLQGVLFVRDLFTLFVCFEIVALAVYLLIAYERDPTALVAGFKYLILSSVGIIFFLLGLFIVYRETGRLSILEPFSVIPAAEESMHLAVAALVVGIGVRTAFIPFHTWLPEAHAYAPHPVSALLSGVVIKVSFFAMVRILDVFEAAHFYEPLMWIGAATAWVAVLRAIAQRDVKKLLAYHSISQMGYVLAALGAAGALGRDAALFHAVNHAFFKSLLFLSVGTAVALTGTRDVYDMPRLGRATPIVALGFWIGALAIAGVPPLNGYFSKAAISAALKGRAAYPLIWLTGVFTVASFLKLGRIFSFGASGQGGDVKISPPDNSGGTLGRAFRATALVVLATICLAGGLVRPLPAPADLVNPAITTGLGVVLFVAISRPGISRALTPLRRWNPGLQTVLAFFFFGLFLFAALGYTRG